MTGGLAAGVRSACCVVSAAVLVAGCSRGEQAPLRPEAPSATPGAASIIPMPSAESSTPSPSSSRLPDDVPTPGRIDQQDATAVSKGALTVMYTVDSTVDTGLRDAKLRAKRYLAPEYIANVEAEPRQYVPDEWRQHRAYLTVRLKPLALEAGAPSDGPTAAYRQWEMTTTPTGRDDWRGAPRKSVVYMALVKSSERESWRISDVVVSNES